MRDLGVIFDKFLDMSDQVITVLGSLLPSQNSDARIVVSASKYDHITPIIQILHWLPVEQRIEFKALLTSCKTLSAEAPEYLRELVSLRSHSELSDHAVSYY